MKRFEVLLTAAAERDLDELHGYVRDFDAPEKADRLLDRVPKLADTLAVAPERGSVPRELRALGRP